MFQLINSKVEIDPNILALPFVKIIWDLDKSKDKSVAYSELSYIFYLIDFKSPYATFDYERRKDLIKRDILKNPKYKESKEVKEALVKYRELSFTPSMELLESARGILKKLKDYFDGVNFSNKISDKNGNEKLEYEPNDVLKSMDMLSKATESINKLEEKVRKEISEKSNVRGSRTLTSYSDPD